LGDGAAVGAGDGAGAGEPLALGVGVAVCALETITPGMAIADITNPRMDRRILFVMDFLGKTLMAEYSVYGSMRIITA
jgi:hypothetical protein